MFDNEALDALASLSDALDAYMGARAFLSRPAAELSFSAFEGERSIACAGVAVLNATRSVRLIAEDWPGGFILKRHVAALDATIRSQFERWQWSDLLGADGLAIVQDRLDAYDEARRVPLLRAALTWRQRPDANPHDNGDRLATEAQHRGLAPMEAPADEPIEDAESRTWSLYFAWRDGPVLGPVRPDFVQVESGTLSGAADGIQRFGRPLLEERRSRRRERALALIAEARLATEAVPEVGPAPVKKDYVERATVAAYQLQHRGEAVNVSAVCRLAGLDRPHLVKKYPEAVRVIKAIAAMDRSPRRGFKSSDGRIEAIDDDE